MEQFLFNSQWKSFIRHSAQHAKHGIVAELDCGITVCWTKCNLIFTNAFFLSCAVSDEVDLRRRLEEIKAYVVKAQPAFPWVFCVEPELLSVDLYKRLQEIFSATNFAHAGNFRCMHTTTTSLLPPVRPLLDAKIKFATSEQDVYDAVLLNAQAYNMDSASAKNVVEHRAFVTDFNKQICCLVLVDDKPVSTATTLLLDDCLYVAFVATSAQHRKVCFMQVLSVFHTYDNAFFSISLDIARLCRNCSACFC